jgi:two-component system OmpR family sensor kinase/two-component system sensor histidine kinase BaeS
MPAKTPLIHRLWFRLTSAFLLVALAGVVIVSLLANRAATTSFRRYLSAGQTAQWTAVSAELGASYAARGDWSGAEAILNAAAGPGQGQGNTFLELRDAAGNIVATSRRRGQQGPGMGLTAELPVESGGVVVGTLSVSAPGGGGGRAAESFLAEVQLTAATQAMAGGELAQQVPGAGPGELGELAGSFNRMAEGLAAAEGQRRQLLADVAHELRTPLSVLRAQLEAMLDGVVPLSADNVALAHEETLLLGRLVEDLRTLSLAEAGQLPLNRRAVAPGDVVGRAAAAFAPLYEAEGVALLTAVDDGLPLLDADPERLQQVLGNLLANALRYAPQGDAAVPTVRLRAARDGQGVMFEVEDSGPGLPPEALAHVFDRFWRTERDRSRQSGGSGLGLAICRAIVLAHGGGITAESEPGVGTTFRFTLPTA